MKNIKEITPPIPSKDDEETAEQEANEFEKQKRLFNLEKDKDDHSNKQTAFDHIKDLVTKWLRFLALLLILNAVELKNLDSWPFNFHISDKVMIALLTTSTATIIGLYLIVAKHLFPP